MVVARERFLDDSSRYRLTLELRSGTGEMHSVLSTLSDEAVERIGDVLVRALDDIAAVLPAAPATSPPRETTSFGCGT
jgi:hypothetical protein